MYAKDIVFPKGENKYRKFETFVHDILDYQEEVIMDVAIAVGELYGLLKMGILRFCLCTESPTDVGEKDNELEDVNMDGQLNDVHERDEQETDAFLDTSEVEIGPYVGEAMANQLNDTLPYQPVLQFEDDLRITFVILPISSALITLDTASTIESSSMLTLTNTTYISPQSAFTCDVPRTSTTITIQLHRVHLLEEMRPIQR